MTLTPQRRSSNLAVAALAGVLAAAVAAPSDAQSRREREAEYTVPRTAGPPVLAVVSLGDQRVTIYDADGKILQAPVSTGRSGYETPAGIYSIIQKNREHYSNLYFDAAMPFMQRITWSGIALHAGALPGYPASHGCIRMPTGFAEQLFDITKLGLRVVVVRDDMRPVDFSHPALIKPGPIRSQVAAAEPAADASADDMQTRRMRLGAPPADVQAPRTWRAVAAARRAEAEKAAEAGDEARRAAVKANGEVARLARPYRMADHARRRAEMQLAEIDRELAAKTTPELEEKKAAATAQLEEAKAQLASLQAERQEKLDVATTAREAARAAEAARSAAATAAKIAENKLAPASVFISRQTQTLYVRHGFRPLFDAPVTIRDPDTPIGTTIFSAVGYTGDGEDVRWTALAMYPGGSGAQPAAAAGGKAQRRTRQAEPAVTDVAAAGNALERVTIPQEAAERIAEFVAPGSALIISDEPLSKETSQGTDFVVVMSGEPQGGIKVRRRSGYGSEGFYRRSPYGYGGPFSSW
jgi:L,D-transpeptidase catalytic domain